MLWVTITLSKAFFWLKFCHFACLNKSILCLIFEFRQQIFFFYTKKIDKIILPRSFLIATIVKPGSLYISLFHWFTLCETISFCCVTDCNNNLPHPRDRVADRTLSNDSHPRNNFQTFQNFQKFSCQNCILGEQKLGPVSHPFPLPRALVNVIRMFD